MAPYGPADGAWVSPERMAQYVPAKGKEFALLVPDFVMEIRSATDRLTKTRQKNKPKIFHRIW